MQKELLHSIAAATALKNTRNFLYSKILYLIFIIVK